MVQSDEPAVVLSSLARLSNPSFSDACAIELSEGTETPFRVCFPMPGAGELLAGPGSVHATASTPPVAFKAVITKFQAESGHGYPSFAGIIVHSWATRDPTEDDAIIARLLVDHALAIIHSARVAEAAARADSRAAKLAIDLITSRIEGEAIGILMAKHDLTRAGAASMLRNASHSSGRELSEIAAGVTHAGDLDALSRRDARTPGLVAHLQVAASRGRPTTRAEILDDSSLGRRS
jgi:ANTAR domain